MDPDSDAISFALVAPPSHGTLVDNHDGSFTYTPASAFAGKDTFTYVASDSIVDSDPVTVTISVLGDAAITNDDEFAVEMNQTLSIGAPGVLWNDAAPAGSVLTASLVSSVTTNGGTVSMDPSGSFIYAPPENFTGDDTFSYYPVVDGVPGPNPANVVVHVIGVDLEMAEGPWVPVNANNDNGSPWRANSNNMIPQVRDAFFTHQLPNSRTDPELKPLNITLNAPAGVKGWIYIDYRTDVSGYISLWTDQRKTQNIFGWYPLSGPGALPPTIFVEGIYPSGRTMDGELVQATPDPDKGDEVALMIGAETAQKIVRFLAADLFQQLNGTRAIASKNRSIWTATGKTRRP